MAKDKNFKNVVIAVSILCVLCTTPLYLDRLLTISLNLLAPRTKQFDIQKPQLLYHFPNAVTVISWSDNASHLILHIYGGATHLAEFNLKTGTVVVQEERISKNEVLPPEIIQPLGTNTWALCKESNRLVAAGDFEGEQYWLKHWENEELAGGRLEAEPFWLKYWENEELVDTFYFSSKQWPADNLMPGASIEFSPSCNKASLTLSGWVYEEGYGKEELWILDIASHTFEQLLIGRSPIFGLWDYPVQHVTPSWSPGEDLLVFGGWTFGLEVYDLSSSKRRILTGPHYNLFDAQWSPSGKWIAALQSGDEVDRLYIFSPDGSLHSMTEGCGRISKFQWAPQEDKIAFTCSSDNEGDDLWLWNLE